MPMYVIDSNVLITAHRFTYPLDIAVSFWSAIKDLADKEKLISIDKVYGELKRNEDDLLDWVDSQINPGFFKDSDTKDILDNYVDMVAWAESVNAHYNRGAIDDFMEFDRADAWLVAYCKTFDYVLVTQEVSRPEQKSAIPIPQVCMAHGVRFCNTIQMFREMKVSF